MAVFATGFTKSFATSASGINKEAQKAATMERLSNRKREGSMPAIIEGDRPRGISPLRKARENMPSAIWFFRNGEKSAPPPPVGRFRMAQLELFSLQSGAGAGNAVEPPLLALPDSAPRQVSCKPGRTPGPRPGATDCDRRSRAATKS